MVVDIFFYESDLNFPLKNENVFFRDFIILKNRESEKEVLLLLLIEKQSKRNEQFLLSIIFSKLEKTFINGSFFLHLPSNDLKKFFFLSNYGDTQNNSLYYLLLASKKKVQLSEIDNGHLKVKRNVIFFSY